MDRSKLYRLIGTCYNNSDYSPLEVRLSKNIIFESYDFLYKLKGRERVMEHLAERARLNRERPEEKRHLAHYGFYRKPFLAQTYLAECVVICRKDNSPVRVVSIEIKRGKISQITGLDPATVDYTRGALIT